MDAIVRGLSIVFLSAILLVSVSAQDIRSATGMPIPIGADVIWGQIELKGLEPDEPRPVVTVLLMFNGVQLDTSQANDKGYYYFLQKSRDAAQLVVRVAGMEMGRVMIFAATQRYDMSVNWSGANRASPPGVISAKDAYTTRSSANQKLLDKAIKAVEKKNNKEAISLMLEIVAADPNDYIAWSGLGSLYRSQSKLSDAEKAYERALELKPDLMIALLSLGKLHLSNKSFEKAIAILGKAVAVDPTSADAHHFLGEAYLQAKLGSKAVPVLNEAIRLAPLEKAELHLRLAALYDAAGLKDRAAAEYELFLERKPNFEEKDKLQKYIKDHKKDDRP